MTYMRKLGEQLLQQALMGCWNKPPPSRRAAPTQGGEWGQTESGALPESSPLSKPHSLVALDTGPAPNPQETFCPGSRERDTREQGEPSPLGFSGRTRIGPRS